MKKYKESILYIVFIIVIFIFTIIKTAPQLGNIIKIEKELGEKKTQSADLEKRLEDLKRAEMEKLTITGPTKKIFKPETSGDTEANFSLMFDDIIDIAKYNSVKIYSVKYTYNPPEDEFIKSNTGKYNVCQLNMEIIVDYQNLETFIKDLLKYPYLINIDQLELTPYPKNKRILLVNFQLKLYSQI